jgi:hypothetical protein
VFGIVESRHRFSPGGGFLLAASQRVSHHHQIAMQTNAAPLTQILRAAYETVRDSFYVNAPGGDGFFGKSDVGIATIALSVTDLDSAELPAVSVPVALPNQSADRFFNVDRRRRVINRRWRRWARSECTSEQGPADKAAHYAGGNLTVLRSCRHRQ